MLMIPIFKWPPACLTKRASTVALLATDQRCLLRSGLCSQPPSRLSEGTTLAGVYLCFLFCLCVCFYLPRIYGEPWEKTPSLKQWFEKREKAMSDSWMDEGGRDLLVLCPFWPSPTPRLTFFLTAPGALEVGPCHQGVPERQEGSMQTGKRAWRLQPRASPRMRRPALGNLGPDDRRTSWLGSNIFGS